MNLDTVNINIDWNKEQSIQAAEALKLKLENEGWKLVNHFGGMVNTIMVYGRIRG